MEEKTTYYLKQSKDKEKTAAIIEENKLEELIFEDNSKYFGKTIDGKATGEGKLWLTNGDYY